MEFTFYTLYPAIITLSAVILRKSIVNFFISLQSKNVNMSKFSLHWFVRHLTISSHLMISKIVMYQQHIILAKFDPKRGDPEGMS